LRFIYIFLNIHVIKIILIFLTTPSVTNYLYVNYDETRGNFPELSAEIEGDYITENKLRSILKQEIMITIKSTVESVMSEHLRVINEQMLGFQEAMSFFNHLYEDLKSKIEEKSTTVIELQKENAELKSSVRDLSERLCSVEQNMREGNVEIVGVPEFRNENLTNTILQLAKTVDSPINDEDIVHVTRVAKINKQSDKPRSIVVKLRSPRKLMFDNFLDVILTNIPDSTVVMPTSLVTKVDQKHPPLLLNVASHVSQNYLESNPRCDFNFFKADYEKIITELKGINWNNASQNL
ncbi:hypothetical protein SFRURICE_019623, partial [Spodoptera frugiperda]